MQLHLTVPSELKCIRVYIRHWLLHKYMGIMVVWVLC